MAARARATPSRLAVRLPACSSTSAELDLICAPPTCMMDFQVVTKKPVASKIEIFTSPWAPTTLLSSRTSVEGGATASRPV
eukprot:1880930-Heterocapsa_arctica.AAC.1